MANPARILSTKVLLSHQKQVLTDVGLEVLESNFIEVATKNFELKGIKDNLIFTSQNAVRSFLSHPQFEELKSELQQKKVFCVGVKSKTILTDAGFEVVAYADYAEDLAEIISLIYANANYTFFSGFFQSFGGRFANAKAQFFFDGIVFQITGNSGWTKK